MKLLKATKTQDGWTFEYSTVTKKIQRTTDDRLARQWIEDLKEIGYKITHFKGHRGMFQSFYGEKA